MVINKICKLNRVTIGSNSQQEYINYLDTGNITKNKITEIKKLINGIDKYPSRAQRIVQKGTIIYSTVRPEQEHFGIIEIEIENLIVSTGFTTLDVIDKNVDSKYLYYKLTNKSVTDYLNVIATNNVTSYPSLNPSDIGNLEFSIPEAVSSQQKIAKVLSDLDAKIELNNKINDNLEQMSKTLYDYWFVQFDFPDANGKPYKTSGGKMVYNIELKREIPEEWEVKKLADVLEIKYGKDHKKLDEGFIPVYGSGGIMRYVDKYIYDNESILIPRKGTLSNLFYINKPFWSVDTMFYSKMKNQHSGKYLFFFLQKLNIASLNVGTAVPSLTTAVLNDLKTLFPSKAILKNFDDVVTPMFEKKEQNIKETEQLSMVRDWLLPMLMNGQVQVSDKQS